MDYQNIVASDNGDGAGLINVLIAKMLNGNKKDEANGNKQ